MQIPERLVNFACYGGATSIEFLGMTDVELPTFEAMSETITGAGIAGEYESPVAGHLKSQVLKLKWRTMSAAALGLLAPVQHVLDLRGSVALQDPMLGVLSEEAVRIEVRGQVKNFTPGKLEPGKVMETTADIEAAVIRITVAGVQVVELDKFNMVYKINGTDYLRQTRVNIGRV